MRAVVITFLLAAGPAIAADPDAGQRVFRSQCTNCHAVAPGRNGVGPSLVGLIGRKAGSVPGFRYSPANQAADITWSAAALDPYLLEPKAAIPGSTMVYARVKGAGPRADLIAYLETLE